MIIPASEFNELYNCRLNRGLGKGWTGKFDDAFHKVWPSCPLVFTDNRFSVSTRRKTHGPFWTGKARCRTGPSCIKANMFIEDQPLSGKDVVVKVTKCGRCTHANNADEICIPVERQNRRQLRGNQRDHVSLHLDQNGNSATEHHFKCLSKMSDQECLPGNTTPCQTPSVFRQATYEKRQRNNLHDGVVTELDIQRQSFVASLPTVHLPGYI